MRKILVIENTDRNGRFLQDGLGSRGFLAEYAPDQKAAVSLLRDSHFEVIFVCPFLDGIRMADYAVTIHPGVIVIFYTNNPTVESAIQALRHGVADYIHIPDEIEDVANRIEIAIERITNMQHAFFPDEILGILSGIEECRELTRREKQVAGLIIHGYSYRQISVKLCISYQTVKTHVYRVYKKLGVGSKNDLASFFSGRVKSGLKR